MRVTGPQRPQIFVTQMLKRDLFVVANLLFDDDDDDDDDVLY